MTYKKIVPEYGDSYLEWDDNGTIRFIPIDPDNSDYQAYLEHEAETK